MRQDTTTDTTSKPDWTCIGEGKAGVWGMPGSGYNRFHVWIATRDERCRVTIRNTWGSHQGYLEEHGRTEVKKFGPANSWQKVADAARTEAINDVDMDRRHVVEAMNEALAEIEEALP